MPKTCLFFKDQLSNSLETLENQTKTALESVQQKIVLKGRFFNYFSTQRFQINFLFFVLIHHH